MATTIFGWAFQCKTLTIWQLYRPHLKKMLVGILYLGVVNGIALFLPRLINWGISKVEGKSVVALSFKEIAFLIIFLAVTGAVVRTLSRLSLFQIGRKIERDLRLKLFTHMALQSADFYERRLTGDLMVNLNNDVTHIRLFTGFAVLNIANLLLIFSATIPILFTISPSVACAVLLPFPVMAIMNRILSKHIVQRTAAYQRSLGNLVEHVQENIQGAQVIRLFRQEEFEKERFKKQAIENRDLAIRLENLRAVLSPLSRVIGGIGVGSALLLGGRSVIEGSMTMGDFVEVNVRLMQMMWPAISLGFVISIYHRGRVSLNRINELLGEKRAVYDGNYEGLLQGAIRLKDLSIEKNQRLLIKDFAWSVEPGKMVAIVGPSGSGKSTLAQVLSRQLPVPNGTYYWGERDVNEIALTAFHQQLAVVPEEPFLFNATLYENIVFGRPGAQKEEVQAMVEKVGLARDIAHFSEGISTWVGERGLQLSGGQRQRVALARALITKPKILVLDGALSAVDVETEKRIMDYLEEEFTGLTRIIISHRLLSMTHADEIIVMKEGAIESRGSHEALLSSSPTYQQLWGKELTERSLEGGES